MKNIKERTRNVCEKLHKYLTNLKTKNLLMIKLLSSMNAVLFCFLPIILSVLLLAKHSLNKKCHHLSENMLYIFRGESPTDPSIKIILLIAMAIILLIAAVTVIFKLQRDYSLSNNSSGGSLFGAVGNMFQLIWHLFIFWAWFPSHIEETAGSFKLPQKNVKCWKITFYSAFCLLVVFWFLFVFDERIILNNISNERVLLIAILWTFCVFFIVISGYGIVELAKRISLDPDVDKALHELFYEKENSLFCGIIEQMIATKQFNYLKKVIGLMLRCEPLIKQKNITGKAEEIIIVSLSPIISKFCMDYQAHIISETLLFDEILSLQAVHPACENLEYYDTNTKKFKCGKNETANCFGSNISSVKIGFCDGTSCLKCKNNAWYEKKQEDVDTKDKCNRAGCCNCVSQLFLSTFYNIKEPKHHDNGVPVFLRSKIDLLDKLTKLDYRAWIDLYEYASKLNDFEVYEFTSRLLKATDDKRFFENWNESEKASYKELTEARRKQKNKKSGRRRDPGDKKRHKGNRSLSNRLHSIWR